MNILELKKEIDFIVENHKHPEDLEVIIPIQGMGGCHERLKGIGVGFDWYWNKLCLYTEEMLVKKIRK